MFHAVYYDTLLPMYINCESVSVLWVSNSVVGTIFVGITAFVYSKYMMMDCFTENDELYPYH